MDENQISKQVIGHAMNVHPSFGPGLFETVYRTVLEYEIINAGFSVQRQSPIPVFYNEIKKEAGFWADLIVNNKVLLELKSIEAIHDVHKKQVLTYLKLTNLKLGLLINFNTDRLKNGIARIVNNL